MSKFVSREDANRGFEFQVIDDAGDKVDWFISVVGADADVYRAKQNEQRRRNIANVNRTKSLMQTMANVDSDAIELIVVATTGWRGKEAMAEFSLKEAERIYTEFPQIREQADRAISERANFLAPRAPI